MKIKRLQLKRLADTAVAVYNAVYKITRIVLRTKIKIMSSISEVIGIVDILQQELFVVRGIVNNCYV